MIKMEHEIPTVNLHSDPCSELCSIHKAEIVKFYCKDHDFVGCGDCMVLDHETCSVKLVPDVSGNYASSTDFQQIKKNIEFLKSEISSHRNEIQTDMKAADEMRENVVKEMKKFRQEINEYLDSTEINLLRQIDELKPRYLSKLDQVQKEFENMEISMKECQSKINQNSDMINQLFVTAKLSQKTLQKCHVKTQQLMSECENVSCIFVPSKDLKTFLENECLFGEIIVQTRKFNAQCRKCFVDMETSFVKNLAVLSEKEDDCYISAMAMISSDEILLVDNGSSFLKIINVNVNKITSKYETTSPPWDITVVDSASCAVTLSSEGKILFIITSNGISESHSLNVRKNCRGIDYRNGLLVVSFVFPAAFQILDIKGTVLYNIDGENISISPNFVVLSNDNQSLFVSDISKARVLEISLVGDFTATVNYEGMNAPHALAMTHDGTVVVCCEGNINIVSMIVPSTRQILPLAVNCIESPGCLAICENQNKLYLYELPSSEIKIFALK